jgi:hypothetical protein
VIETTCGPTGEGEAEKSTEKVPPRPVEPCVSVVTTTLGDAGFVTSLWKSDPE